MERPRTRARPSPLQPRPPVPPHHALGHLTRAPQHPLFVRTRCVCVRCNPRREHVSPCMLWRGASATRGLLWTRARVHHSPQTHRHTWRAFPPAFTELWLTVQAVHGGLACTGWSTPFLLWPTAPRLLPLCLGHIPLPPPVAPCTPAAPALAACGMFAVPAGAVGCAEGRRLGSGCVTLRGLGEMGPCPCEQVLVRFWCRRWRCMVSFVRLHHTPHCTSTYPTPTHTCPWRADLGCWAVGYGTRVLVGFPSGRVDPPGAPALLLLPPPSTHPRKLLRAAPHL